MGIPSSDKDEKYVRHVRACTKKKDPKTIAIEEKVGGFYVCLHKIDRQFPSQEQQVSFHHTAIGSLLNCPNKMENFSAISVFFCVLPTVYTNSIHHCVYTTQHIISTVKGHSPCTLSLTFTQLSTVILPWRKRTTLLVVLGGKWNVNSDLLFLKNSVNN